MVNERFSASPPAHAEGTGRPARGEATRQCPPCHLATRLPEECRSVMASGWVSVCRWMSPWRSKSATPEGRTRGRTEVVEAMWIDSFERRDPSGCQACDARRARPVHRLLGGQLASDYLGRGGPSAVGSRQGSTLPPYGRAYMPARAEFYEIDNFQARSPHHGWLVVQKVTRAFP